MNFSVDIGQQLFDLSFEQVIFKTVTPEQLMPALHALPNIHQHFGIDDTQFKPCDFVLVYFWSSKCALWEKYSPILGKYYHELYQARRAYYPLILFCDVYEYPQFTRLFQHASDNLIILRNSPVAFAVKKFDFTNISLPNNVPIHPLVFLQTMIGCVQPHAIDELIRDTESFTIEDFLTSQLIKNHVKQATTLS